MCVYLLFRNKAETLGRGQAGRFGPRYALLWLPQTGRPDYFKMRPEAHKCFNVTFMRIAMSVVISGCLLSP